MQLTMSNIDPNHLCCTTLQQTVCKSTGALANVQATQPFHTQARGTQRAIELQATTRDVFGLGIIQQLQLRTSGNVITILDDLFPGSQRCQSPLHPSSNQALGL